MAVAHDPNPAQSTGLHCPARLGARDHELDQQHRVVPDPVAREGALQNLAPRSARGLIMYDQCAAAEAAATEARDR